MQSFQRVLVAGRDLIHTQNITRRNTITLDERHLSNDQRESLMGVAREVSARLPGTGNMANLSAVHRMLQTRFRVASYLLIPREEYPAALSFLRQQRAINRDRLLRRDPRAYRNDLYRSIFAAARELRWDTTRVLALAQARFGTRILVNSLKDLGPFELKELTQIIQREVGSLWIRASRTRSGARR